MQYFISGNTPSSKNSRQFNTELKMSFSSKASQKWNRTAKAQFLAQKQAFLAELHQLKPPYYIEFTFAKLTRAKFDYHNAIQIVADAMRDYGWIVDDDTTQIKPYFGDARHDKKNPGVYIEILKEKPLHKLPVTWMLATIIACRDEYRAQNPEAGEKQLKEIYLTIKKLMG